MLINIVDLTDIVPIVASLSPVLKQIAYQNAANIGAIKYCTNVNFFIVIPSPPFFVFYK